MAFGVDFDGKFDFFESEASAGVGLAKEVVDDRDHIFHLDFEGLGIEGNPFALRNGCLGSRGSWGTTIAATNVNTRSSRFNGRCGRARCFGFRYDPELVGVCHLPDLR